MRFDIAKSGSGLIYEIRHIVAVANKLQEYGVELHWENIGDPVQKGEKIPQWMKEVLFEVLSDDLSFGYSPTKGITATREFLAERVNQRGGIQISAEDIIFFNGLGDAIARAYSSIHVDARIIMPEPTYSTHLLAEVLHASFPPNTYRLNPYSNWQPDIRELEQKVKSHHAIVGILVINPDNPTGYVYPEEKLRQIVDIARRYDLFVVVDETYHNILYNGKTTVWLSDIIGNVPGISMKGISKEFPWPGSRCGWIEVYNATHDELFARYVKSVLDSKMLEVCSTTLPQSVIPKIMSDPRYETHLANKNAEYKKRAEFAHQMLSAVPGIIAPKPSGAFYMSIVFSKNVLNEKQTLPITDNAVRMYLEEKVEGVPNDKRFVYYLMGATGICT